MCLVNKLGMKRTDGKIEGKSGFESMISMVAITKKDASALIRLDTGAAAVRPAGASAVARDAPQSGALAVALRAAPSTAADAAAGAGDAFGAFGAGGTTKKKKALVGIGNKL